MDIKYVYIKDISKIIIPAKKTKLETITVMVSISTITGIEYFYGKAWFHYLVGALLSLLMILPLYRKGITSDGFRTLKGIKWGNWNTIEKVYVKKNNNVELSITSESSHWDNQLYRKEDYNKIIDILKQNLTTDVVKVL